MPPTKHAWRRKFDQRAIRANPDKAWSEWQECMGRSR